MMDPAADLAAQLTRLADRDTYLRAASELLLKLFPSERLAWNALDTQAGTAEVLVYPDYPVSDIAAKLLEVWDDHPLVLSYLNDTADGIWRPRRLSDLVSDQKLYQTRAYQVGLAALETNRQLSFLTTRPGTTSIHGWAMNRWNVDFSDREVELARSIQPMLRLLDLAYGDGDAFEAQRNTADAYSLTIREREVMQLIGQGLTAIAIGHLLGISPRTVCKHLEHAYAKLGCNNRVDAVSRFSGR